ncbi:MAG: radical SAM protein [bacterium]|nr:radical SAM protein [bacterium]
MFQPKSLILQWHITERCNWRCKHCYQESYTTPEINLEMLGKVLDQYVNLVKKWQIPRNRAKINITGGEPMIREDFFQFLGKVYKLSEYFHLGILSNGSFLTKENVKFLKFLGVRNFQVSLEGIEKTNDEIRGKGSFQKVLKAIEILTWAGIPARVSVTLSKKNRPEMKELAGILAPLGVKSMGVRRIVPWGAGAQFKDEVLEPQELRTLYKELEEINRTMIKNGYELKVAGGCENGVFNDEISAPGLMSFSHCAVVDGRILVLLPNGDVLPCRRLPIKIGNVYEKSLEEIYYSPLYEDWRNQKDLTEECRSCSNFENCFGGAKCVTYAITGKTAPDVQCWKLFNNLEEAINKIR